VTINANTQILADTSQNIWLLFNGTSANVVLVGNSSQADVATGNDVLTGAIIRSLFFSTNGAVTVTGVVNPTSNVSLVLQGSDHWTSEVGFAALGPYSNLAVSYAAGVTGSTIMELRKEPYS
jgi:hypothetical protein